MSDPAYPVRVDARLDDHLSRWLWLVKWLLAIPHYVVLAFLWLAFVVLSVVALVAILFTGRYPRVDLRLQRRRAALDLAGHLLHVRRARHRPVPALHPRGATGLPRAPRDRLPRPPLPRAGAGEVVAAGDPALPGARASSSAAVGTPPRRPRRAGWNGGLIGLLVLVAAVVLLFTGSYPRSIFDLVLGLNRWALRVAAYASLMTDVYPPFRLDMGGTDPGTGVLTLGIPPGTNPAGPTPASTTHTSADGSPDDGAGTGRWWPAHVAAVRLTLGGGSGHRGRDRLDDGDDVAGPAGRRPRPQDRRQRPADDAGYLMSSTKTYGSPGFAVTSQNIDLSSDSANFDVASRWLGTVRIEAQSRTAGQHLRRHRPDQRRGRLPPRRRAHDGQRPVGRPRPPGDDVRRRRRPALRRRRDLLGRLAHGQGQQTVTWEAEDGDWTIVVMNTEGTAPVAARVSAGAEVPILDTVVIGLLVAGVVLLALSTLVLVLAIRRR